MREAPANKYKKDSSSSITQKNPKERWQQQLGLAAAAAAAAAAAVAAAAVHCFCVVFSVS